MNVLESLELLLQEAEGWERGVNEVIILKKIQNPQEILSLDGYLQKKKKSRGRGKFEPLFLEKTKWIVGT